MDKWMLAEGAGIETKITSKSVGNKLSNHTPLINLITGVAAKVGSIH